jgi:hypothetical protein
VAKTGEFTEPETPVPIVPIIPTVKVEEEDVLFEAIEPKTPETLNELGTEVVTDI